MEFVVKCHEFVLNSFICQIEKPKYLNSSIIIVLLYIFNNIVIILFNMRPKNKEKRLMVHVYLKEEEKKRIEEQASKLGISVSAYIKVKLFQKNGTI